MILEKLMALICDEFGMEKDDIDEDTLLEGIVSDEFEMQELVSIIEGEFEVTLEETPADDWSIGDLANAVSSAN